MLFLEVWFFSLWKPLAKLYERYFLCHYGTKYYDWLVAKYGKRNNIVCGGILCSQEYIYLKRTLVRSLKFLHYAYARSHISDNVLWCLCSVLTAAFRTTLAISGISSSRSSLLVGCTTDLSKSYLVLLLFSKLYVQCSCT